MNSPWANTDANKGSTYTLLDLPDKIAHLVWLNTECVKVKLYPRHWSLNNELSNAIDGSLLAPFILKYHVKIWLCCLNDNSNTLALVAPLLAQSAYH